MRRLLDWLLPVRLLPPATAMILIIGLGLSACATASAPIASPEGDPFCQHDGPIFYDSSAVTAGTAEQIDRHNRVWVCMCEDDCPPE